MSWLDTLRTGLEAVRTHRLRSGLTVLGIMIGIAAVILTVGLGQGAQDQISSQINALGTNLLTISPGSSTSSSGIRGGFGSASTLTEADATALSSKTRAVRDTSRAAMLAQAGFGKAFFIRCRACASRCPGCRATARWRLPSMHRAVVAPKPAP